MSTRTLFLEILNTTLPFVVLFFLGFGIWSQAVNAGAVVTVVQLVGMISYLVDYSGRGLSPRTLWIEAVNSALTLFVLGMILIKAEELAVTGCALLFALQVLGLWSAIKDQG